MNQRERDLLVALHKAAEVPNVAVGGTQSTAFSGYEHRSIFSHQTHGACVMTSIPPQISCELGSITIESISGRITEESLYLQIHTLEKYVDAISPEEGVLYLMPGERTLRSGVNISHEASTRPGTFIRFSTPWEIAVGTGKYSMQVIGVKTPDHVEDLPVTFLPSDT